MIPAETDHLSMEISDLDAARYAAEYESNKRLLSLREPIQDVLAALSEKKWEEKGINGN